MKLHTIISALFILTLSLLLTNLKAQCPDGTHSPFPEDAWLSCAVSQSPVEDLGRQHWIQYDLDHIYSIDSLLIWNYNVWGDTGNGMKTIQLWSSVDGLNWKQWGSQFEIQEAPGSWRYNKPEVIDLGGIQARHILVVGLETWDASSSCAGLSELRIFADAITSSDEITSAESRQIAIGPNPTSGELNIYLKNGLYVYNVKVYNSLGQLFKVVNEINQPKYAFNVADWPDGLYHIIFNTEQGYIQKEFVKTRP